MPKKPFRKIPIPKKPNKTIHNQKKVEVFATSLPKSSKSLKPKNATEKDGSKPKNESKQISGKDKSDKKGIDKKKDNVDEVD